MAIVSFQLGRAALVDGATGAIAVASAVLLHKWKVNPTWLILGGAAFGTASHLR
jgi:chromate transporter